jgi:hypothetical protein
MKYFLVFILFLIGCASQTKVEQPKPILHEYSCAAFMVHGTYAHWEGDYATDDDAMADAIIINSRLIEQRLIPNSCIPLCYNKENPYNMIFPKQNPGPKDSK